jgi:hypothetical protein
VTNVDDGLKQTIDLISVTTVFGTLMGILPSIAAIFSIIWSAIRIYETETFQKFLENLKKDKL